ncbi:MAG TPA: HD domain-containing phosphohydrolase [Methylomirabilota bacterium]|nr:HD domain-containing phosphohydrolase [Methylomirabilota bacterium]
MARLKGLLLWSPDQEATGFRELLAEDPEIVPTPLGEAGELPPSLPQFEQVVILADWAKVARDPAIVDQWRRTLGEAAVAVVVSADRGQLGEAARVLGPLPVDDFLEVPCDPAHLTRKLRTTFRYLADLQAALRLRSELVRQVVDFKEFNRVALALSAERDVNRLMELILTKCREVTTADAGSLYLVEEKEAEPGRWEIENERMLRFVVAQNDSKSLDLKAARLPLNRASLAGYVALTRTPLNLPDVYRLPPGVEYAHSPRMDQALGYRTVSMLVIPMVDHTDEIIAVIQVINKKRSPRIRLDTPEAAQAEAQPFGARDQEMVTSLASLAAVALNKALLLSRIERLLEGIVRASVTAIEQRDPATAGHSDRVARLTVGLARVVDGVSTGEYRDVRFTREELKEIEYAAILHDIGKVGVREHILVKAKKLFDPEINVIRSRFDFIKRTLQYEYSRKMIEVIMRLGAEAARSHVKQLEEDLAQKLGEVDEQLELVRQLNEPSVSRSEIAANLRMLGDLRYLYFDGTLRPYLSEYEIRNLSIPRGSLNDEERLEIESHVTHSFRFLMQIPWTKELRRVPLIAYSHHERLDGSGYPRGVRDVEVPIQARMMTIADVFDALAAADRPYKPAVPPDRALDILRSEAQAGRIDRVLLDLFVAAKVYDAHGSGRPRAAD